MRLETQNKQKTGKIILRPFVIAAQGKHHTEQGEQSDCVCVHVWACATMCSLLFSIVRKDLPNKQRPGKMGLRTIKITGGQVTT